MLLIVIGVVIGFCFLGPVGAILGGIIGLLLN